MSDNAKKISQLYQQSATELPPPQLDQLILQQAQQALKKEPTSRWWQNKFMLASAASVGFAFLLFNQYSGIWHPEDLQLPGTPSVGSLPEYDDLLIQSRSSQTAQRQRKVSVAKQSTALPQYTSAKERLADAPKGVVSIIDSAEATQSDQAEVELFKQQTDSDMLALTKEDDGLMATDQLAVTKPDIDDIGLVARRYADAESSTEVAPSSVARTSMADRSAPEAKQSEGSQQPNWQTLVKQIKNSQGAQKKQRQKRLFEALAAYLSKRPTYKVDKNLLQFLEPKQQESIKQRFAEQVQ